MNAGGTRSQAVAVVMLIAAGSFLLVSCSSTKNRVYTSGIFPVFMDDSTASVFLLDVTETEKSMASPRVTAVAIRGYRVNYRRQSEISTYMPSVNAGDLRFGPTVSLVGDSVFITSPFFRNPLILIDRRTGALVERTFDFCCLGRVGVWVHAGAYLAQNDSGALVIIDLSAGSTTRISPDSIMGIQVATWHDLRLENGKPEALASIGDTLLYLEKDVRLGTLARWPLPEIPQDLKPYGDPSVSFANGGDYLRITTAEAGGHYFTLPLKALKSNPGEAVWTEELRWIFNKDVTVKTRNVRNESMSHVDPALVRFQDLTEQTLAQYDFSSLIRK
ncbi:MAG: hypothetical protein M3Y08_05250 [Fibrobacterota bacterium]|nr:hypothetical protein [Fibrobacterota bacterium]